MTSQNFLFKAIAEFFSKPPEEIFPKNDSSIDKSLDFALSLPQYLSALSEFDRSKVVNLMEFILNNPLPAYLKKMIIFDAAHRKHRKARKIFKIRANPRDTQPKKKKSKKKSKVAAQVATYVEHESIDGTEHNIVFRLDRDQVMEVRRGKFAYRREPKIPVRENKAFEYRESHSSYCGERKTLKNWLYFV